jgi:uncharacterized membrane protein
VTLHATDASRAAFALAMIALGAHALATHGTVGVWGPVPHGVPAPPGLPWFIGGLVVACGLGLPWRRTLPIAARVLAAWLLLWLLLARLVDAMMAPAIAGYWSGCGETLVPLAATWTLLALPGWRGPVVARVMYGLALIPFGAAHVVYLKETASLVPAWLPAPRAWAIATGATYLAAGLALLAGWRTRLAAGLVALQIAGFTALVWLPIVASGQADVSAWSETAISLMLSAAAWVLAQAMPRRD